MSESFSDAGDGDLAYARQEDDLVSHWEVLPEWPSTRALYACYATASDQPELRALVADYQRHLSGLLGLDLIRPEWLHMTIQGIAFLDELSPEAADGVSRRLDRALARIEPIRAMVERPVVTGDSALMPVRPIGPVAALRDEIRSLLAATPEVGELYVLPGQDSAFDPHFSIAYVNAPLPRAELAAAIEACPREPLEITLRTVSLITLIRDQPRYHWIGEHPIRLGG